MMTRWLCWILYWIGHGFSKLFEATEFEVFFDAYNWFMTKSVNIQDKYDIENGPWVPLDEVERAAINPEEFDKYQ